MSAIFAVRGTALNAYYARFADTCGLMSSGATGGAPVVTSSVDPNVFGGSYIAKANGTGLMRALHYPGYANTPPTGAFSMLFRIIPRWTGAPSIHQTLIALGGYSGSGLNKLELSLPTSGALTFRQTNDNNSNATLNTTASTYNGWVSGTPADIMVVWTGTTASGGLRWSINGVEIGTATVASAFTVNIGLRSGITVGAGVDSNHSNWDLNELVIFDSVESHTYTARTDFYSVPNTIGYPVAATVKTGVTLPVTGSYTDSVGTYDGSDRWSDPGESNVVEGVSYKANSTSNNKTGTVGASVDPLVANVKLGTNYTINGSAKVGTLYAPPTAVTRNWAPSDVQIAVYNHLASDDTIITLLGENSASVNLSNKVFDHVPQDTAYPFVVVQINPWEDRGSYTKEGLEATLSIHVWYRPGITSVTGRGDKQVQAIQKRIDEILHANQIPISGWKNLIFRRALIDILVEPDNVTRHGIQQFKLLLGGS